VIRAAAAPDIEAIADLQRRAILAAAPAHYGPAAAKAWARFAFQMRHRLLDGGNLLLHEEAGRILGTAGFIKDSREADCAWPRQVFVAPEAVRRGIGRGLMAAVEAQALACGRERFRLWSSLNAEPFYLALGYRTIRPVRWPIGGEVELDFLLMEKQGHPPCQPGAGGIA
jgi:putative acetyltransferase